MTKTVTNQRLKLENSFQEILYMIDVCIDKGSDWNVESIESQYIYISTYTPLSGSSCISLPVELKNPRKGLVNIKKTKIKNIFYVRHINTSKEHPEKIRKIDKKFVKHTSNPE